MIVRALVAALLASFLAGSAVAQGRQTVELAETLVQDSPSPGVVAVVAGGRAADLRVAANAPEVVRIAATDLAVDLEAVTGVRPRLRMDAASGSGASEVWIGVLGRDPRIDRLVRERRLDVRGLKGAWESFVIAAVDRPRPGLDAAMVIVGSDPRGAAYGVYELSQAAGVSPWSWWADVPARKQPALYLAAGARRFGPPSVKFRGIFINDEDWGLQPWAARTFDPERGDIGPKTYERVFKLMLRLKANTLWPAMHRVTAPFHADLENRRLAAAHAIVLGSSHAEPMFRNNVSEWKDDPAGFDYAKNAEGVRRYWEARTREMARQEGVYTLGMRGIHDSGMVGAATPAEKRALLEQIFSDQRAMLRRHFGPDLKRTPQAFTAYKEVLEIYESGLRVPDDVILVWPDDNFGYIRRLPTPAERARAGGSGVYYHLSYLGAPLSYLWLSTTPPALIWEEMSKAYDQGARTLWIANVGDIKPAEIAVDFFLQLAWDRDRWTPETLPQFLAGWSRQQFGPENGPAIAAVLERWYALNGERRPDQLQWHRSGERRRPSPWTGADAQVRMDAFDALVGEVRRLEAAVAPDQRDAFFELVGYPVEAAAAANARLLHLEAYARLIDVDPPVARAHGGAARQADAALQALTRRYNEDTAGGKWRFIMSVEPADNQWPQFRTLPVPMPAEGLTRAPADGRRPRFDDGALMHTARPMEAEDFVAAAGGGVAWRPIPGLGRGRGAMALLPTTIPPDPAAPPRLEHVVQLGKAGDWRLRLDLVPTFPIGSADALRLAISVDGAAPIPLTIRRRVDDATWSCAVLEGRLSAMAPLGRLSAGPHTLSISALSAGVVLDRIEILAADDPAPDLGCSEAAR